MVACNTHNHVFLLLIVISTMEKYLEVDLPDVYALPHHAASQVCLYQTFLWEGYAFLPSVLVQAVQFPAL